MASPDVWFDFDTLRHNVKTHTVDRLKHILTGFNEECATIFFKTGKKQELIDRITTQLDNWRQANNVEKWMKAKAVLYQVRNSGRYSPSRMNGVAVPLPQNTAGPSSYGPASSIKPLHYHNPSVGSSGVGRYDPYAPPRKSTVQASSSSYIDPKQTLHFKPSPFFRIDQAVSAVVECPESMNAGDRKQQTVTFFLKPDHIAKLHSASPRYQLRLYCTSSPFYSPGPNSFRSYTGPCPIEFPATCEVRVNNAQLVANLKGLKKKPGTAPPADITKSVRTSSSTISNRVEMVYVNSQQPAQPKKFYMVVMLIEVTTVEQLVEKLKKGKYRSSNDVLTKMAQAISEDDDIISGPQKMSLKCPLSFTRINTPSRSTICVHPQCFDATSWFTVMEQTTTWLCPVCEKVLNPDDLIVDGYFDDILQHVPESVEDIMVEADGEWHTEDNKYASSKWKAEHPVKTDSSSHPGHPPSLSKSRPQSPQKASSLRDASGKGKADDKEVHIIDSDDEDEGRVKRELSPSFGSGGSSTAAAPDKTQSHAGDVIDLTVDSDEDEPPVVPTAEKRKAPDAGAPSPTEQIWKKSRVDPLPSAITRPVNGHSNGGPVQSTSRSPEVYGNSYVSNSVHYPTPPSTHSPAIPPSSSNNRYPPSYGSTHTVYNNYPQSTSHAPVSNNHRGISQPYYPRVSGSSSANPRWP